MNEKGTDFIVSELLSELKAENTRKDNQIKGLYKVLTAVVLGSLVAMLMIIAGFLCYLNQYDVSTTTTETITNSAEGIYAIVDSEGNVIGSDYTAEDIQSFLEGVTADGESDEN